MEKKKNNTELDLDEDGIPKLEYIQVGEFLLPNLSLEKVDGYIGRWGIMRKEYLQKHKPAVYSSMLLMDELNQQQMKEWMCWKNNCWNVIRHRIKPKMVWHGQDI